MAQTTRRSRSQPQDFRQCAAGARRQGFACVRDISCLCLGANNFVSMGQYIYIYMYIKRVNMLPGPQRDKEGANHSYAFVPDGDVNWRRRKRQRYSQVTLKTKRWGLHSAAGFVVFSPPTTPTQTEEQEEDPSGTLQNSSWGRKPPDLVSLFGCLRHGKSARTVCVVVFYGC